MTEIRVAVLGASGWMGKVHTMAWATFPHFCAHAPRARVTALVTDNPADVSDLAARAPGARVLTDWQDAVNDPEIDLIDIRLPDHLHFPVAKAALLAGKHLYCEKPLADPAAEARILADLAHAQGMTTRVGHAFPRNPVHDLARDILPSGEIGAIRLFMGCQHMHVFGDPASPFMWRADDAPAPTGIVGDTGTHVFSVMAFPVGPVSSLVADSAIVTPRRPQGTGWADVTNPDATHLLCRFKNGASCVVDVSRVATRPKFRQTYEIRGTKGSLSYDYDKVIRLQFSTTADAEGRRGYRALDVGPEQVTYGAFLPKLNLSSGYNETRLIEAHEVARAIQTGKSAWPDFDIGHPICQIVDAVMLSASERRRVDVAGAAP